MTRPRAERSSRDHWDERFVLGRIPDYDALKDKHCLNFMLLVTTKRKRNIVTPGRNRRMRTPGTSASRTASKKAFVGTGKVVTGTVLREFREKLMERLLREKLPEEIWAPLLDAMDSCTFRDRIILYAQELEEIERNQSILQVLTQAIQVRELTLKDLYKAVDMFTASTNKGQLITEAKNTLVKLRENSIESLEAVNMYREKIASICVGSKPVPVYYLGKNYVLKVKNDCNFLINSPLSKIFDFSEKSDPFLLHPSHSKQGEYEDIPIAPSLLPRIKVCEKVILEEVLTLRHVSRDRRNDPLARTAITQSNKRTRGGKIGMETRSGIQTRDASLVAVRNLTPTKEDYHADSPRRPGPVIPGTKGNFSEVNSTEMPSTPVKQTQDEPSEMHKVGSHRKNLSSTSKRPHVPLKPSQMGYGGVKPQPPKSNKPDKPSIPYTEDLELRGFELGAEALGSEIEAFVKLAPEQIRETFWTDTSFRDILKSSYSAFLQAIQGGKRLGIIAFSIDTLNTAIKRIHLHLLSAMNISDLARVLDLSLTHFWTTFGCDEVRIALNYRDIDGKLAAEPEIKSLVSERKFKWKNLTNTADGKRMIIMGVHRPEEHDEVVSDFFKESMSIRYAAGIQISQDDSEDAEETSTEKICSYIGFCACLKELATAPETASCDIQSQLMNLHQKLAMTFTFPAFKRGKSMNIYQLLETTRDQGLDLDGLLPGYMTSAACLSIGLRWPVFSTSSLNHLNYIRITDIEVNRANVDSYEIILIPSDDIQFNLVVIRKEGGVEEGVDAWECACGLLAQLTSLGKEFPMQCGEIWIPGFRVRRGVQTVYTLLGLKLTNQTEVVGCSESLVLELEAPVHKLGGVVIRPSADAVVIKEDFILGKTHAAVINRKLDELMPIPYLAARISASSFTKSSP